MTTRAAIEAELVEFSAWKKTAINDSHQHGFASAWDKHVLTFAHAVSHKHLQPVHAAALLAEMMVADAGLRTHLEQQGVLASRQLAQTLSPSGWSHVASWLQNVVSEVLSWWPVIIPGVVEADGLPVVVRRRHRFQNWGRTVDHRPLYTFVPRTKKGVMNIVRWCQQHGKKVRAAGFRHTWSNLYSSEDEVFISMLPLEIAEEIPAKHLPLNAQRDLEGIALVGEITEHGVRKALCKIGASTTNEHFRLWCLDPARGNMQWTIPFNVILVEVTYGGTNAPICHGGGSRTQTLSDLVHEIEFVNAKGELQTVSDPVQLKAAAGCFGLLGVVTSLTLKIDRMSYANMQPKKIPVQLAVPPVSRHDVPAAIPMQAVSDAELAAASQRFANWCEHDYYNEFFWFVFEDKCWIHCWNNDGDAQQARDYPSPTETWFQELENALGEVLLTFPLFQWLPAEVQAKMLAKTAMAVLPADTTIVAPLIDALHFRRGVRNMRCLDFEIAVPIQARADDPTKADWSICQRAWWDAIRAVYELKAEGKIPMRLTLEMRITGVSSVLMAPQHGNQFGSCAIEVLTPYHTPDEEWLAFKQIIIDRWTSYRDARGEYLNSRPHWAKDWHRLTVHGKPIMHYLKQDAYAAVLPEFKQQLQHISQHGGYRYQDAQKLFGNPVFDELLS